MKTLLLALVLPLSGCIAAEGAKDRIAHEIAPTVVPAPAPPPGSSPLEVVLYMAGSAVAGFFGAKVGLGKKKEAVN